MRPRWNFKGLDTSEAQQLIDRMQTTGALKVADTSEIVRLSLAEEEPVIVLVARLTGPEKLETYVFARLREMNDGPDPTVIEDDRWDSFLKVYYTIARYHAWGISVPHAVLPKLTGLAVRVVNNLLCKHGSEILSDKANEYLQGGCGTAEGGWTTDHELIASITVRLLKDPEEDLVASFARTLDQLATLAADEGTRTAASSLAARLFLRSADTPTLLFPTKTIQSPLDMLQPIVEEFIITDKPSSPGHKQLAEALEDSTLAEPLRILEQVATLEELVERYGPGYMRVCRWSDALRVTELGLSYTPSDLQMRAALLVLRGAIHEQMKANDLAVADYEQVLEDFPDQPDLLMAYGRALAALGRYEDAIQSYNASLKIRRRYPDTLTNRGLAYHNMGEYDKALVDYETSLEVRPNDTNTLSNMGVTLTQLNKFEKAFEFHMKAVDADPRHARAISNRGITYYHRAMSHKAAGRKAEAQSDLEVSLRDLTSSLELDDENADALTTRGNVRLELGMTPEAVQDYKDALEVRSDDPIALHNLGHMHYQAGEHDQAETYLNASSLGEA